MRRLFCKRLEGVKNTSRLPRMTVWDINSCVTRNEGIVDPGRWKGAFGLLDRYDNLTDSSLLTETNLTLLCSLLNCLGAGLE